MTHLIIASFDQQEQATEAFTKLQELEKIGDITIYEMAVITKNAEGQASIVEAVTAEGGQPVTGMAVGAVIGALAGPVGMVAGMLVGTLTGEVAELDDYGFEDDFVAKVTDQLKPGASVVVLEVEEDDPVFIDSTLTMMGTEPQRIDVNYEYTKYSDEELEEFEEDILTVRDKLKTAVDEEKDKFRNKIAKLKAKRKERIEELKEQAGERQVSNKEKKVARIRGKIEKHQKKIAELEQKLAGILQENKQDEPEKVDQ
ncbi:MAG TPA: DUF1269 domain-containing protein [Puia sp.]|nr:DUF1269 domain-containing protein [Puia sp.]